MNSIQALASIKSKRGGKPVGIKTKPSTDAAVVKYFLEACTTRSKQIQNFQDFVLDSMLKHNDRGLKPISKARKSQGHK